MHRARTDQAKDDRREVLQTAALHEFFERGFAAARMDDIARRAGLSKGTLYLYFDSKEALFTSLIETFALPNVERIEMAARAAGGARNAIHAVMALAPSLVRESVVPLIAKILIADAPAFPDMATTYRKTVVERVLAVFTNILKDAHEAGEIEVSDPELTARLIVAPIFFSAMWRVVFEHDDEAKFDVAKLFALHEEMLLRALCFKGDAV
jgi:AcrR family transcriptional regulator